MSEINWLDLAAPFDPADIEWRVQQSGMKGDKPWAKVLAYVANRAIQSRLDEVCGPANWRNEYKPAPDGGILCGVSIRVGDEWVTKWDGAENTDVEAVKGGLSNAMKRAAVQWGIGRYLYKLDSAFAKVGDRGDHYIQIKVDNKVAFRGYWDTPDLPSWAMPAPKQEHTPQQSRAASDAERAKYAPKPVPKQERTPQQSKAASDAERAKYAPKPVPIDTVTQDQMREITTLLAAEGVVTEDMPAYLTENFGIQKLREASQKDAAAVIEALSNYKDER